MKIMTNKTNPSTSVILASHSVIPAKAGIQQASEKWIPHQAMAVSIESVRDDKNMNRNDKSSTIPVYGSADQIAKDLHKMAGNVPKGELKIPFTPPKAPPKPQIIASSETVIRPSLNSPPVGERFSTKKVAILLVALILAVGTYLYFQKDINPFRSASLSINNLQDQQTNQKITNITGLDWHNISTKTTGTKEEKLTALLLLHEEESWIFQKYNSLVAGKYLKPEQLSSLKAVTADPNKQNAQALLENLTATVNVYNQIKVPEAQVHQNRLEILKKYFAKYEISDADQIPKEADAITLASHPAQNQKDLMKLLLQRFNIFKGNIK